MVASIFTDKAAKPNGHYSQAIEHNGLIYVSGQLGIDPNAGEIVVGPIEEQATLALQNIENILKAAGSELSKIIKVNVYVADISLWEPINEVYSAFFNDHEPARIVIPCGTLHLGFQCAFDVIAAA